MTKKHKSKAPKAPPLVSLDDLQRIPVKEDMCTAVFDYIAPKLALVPPVDAARMSQAFTVAMARCASVSGTGAIALAFTAEDVCNIVTRILSFLNKDAVSLRSPAFPQTEHKATLGDCLDEAWKYAESIQWAWSPSVHPTPHQTPEQPEKASHRAQSHHESPPETPPARASYRAQSHHESPPETPPANRRAPTNVEESPKPRTPPPQPPFETRAPSNEALAIADLALEMRKKGGTMQSTHGTGLASDIEGVEFLQHLGPDVIYRWRTDDPAAPTIRAALRSMIEALSIATRLGSEGLIAEITTTMRASKQVISMEFVAMLRLLPNYGRVVLLGELYVALDPLCGPAGRDLLMFCRTAPLPDSKQEATSWRKPHGVIPTPLLRATFPAKSTGPWSN